MGKSKGSSTRNRPTDEEILQFENEIRDEQVNKQPLVSPKLPTSLLKEEYYDNEIFKEKIEFLEIKYPMMRRMRGDGNCFFRALSFALINHFCLAANRNKVVSWRGRVEELMKSVGFDKLAYEDFLDDFMEMLTVPNSPESAVLEWEVNPSKSHSMVVILRLIASAYLRSHSDQYLPFIMDSVGEDGNMAVFCQKWVEGMGVESDQIHVIAVGKALNINILIAYLDQSDGPPNEIIFKSSDATEVDVNGEDVSSSDITITLLYRPGHYDLLYTTSTLRSLCSNIKE